MNPIISEIIKIRRYGIAGSVNPRESNFDHGACARRNASCATEPGSRSPYIAHRRTRSGADGSDCFDASAMDSSERADPRQGANRSIFV